MITITNRQELEQEIRLIAMNTESIYLDVINPEVDITEPVSAVALRLELETGNGVSGIDLRIMTYVLQRERNQYLKENQQGFIS